MTIRPERPDDASSIRHVNELAFGQPAEANLVDQLREACANSLSLVAADGAVVGHILFTPVVIEAEDGASSGWDWRRWRCSPIASGRASARNS